MRARRGLRGRASAQLQPARCGRPGSTWGGQSPRGWAGLWTQVRGAGRARAAQACCGLLQRLWRPRVPRRTLGFPECPSPGGAGEELGVGDTGGCEADILCSGVLQLSSHWHRPSPRPPLSMTHLGQSPHCPRREGRGDPPQASSGIRPSHPQMSTTAAGSRRFCGGHKAKREPPPRSRSPPTGAGFCCRDPGGGPGLAKPPVMAESPGCCLPRNVLCERERRWARGASAGCKWGAAAAGFPAGSYQLPSQRIDSGPQGKQKHPWVGRGHPCSPLFDPNPWVPRGGGSGSATL